MTDTTTPRCPVCHEPMKIFGENQWYCYTDQIGTYDPTPPPPRVPCPACDGTGWPDTGCDLCRSRGNVPPALAAAWTADGEG